ncbi:MAG: hypothetical protein ACLFUO_02780 [Candidatus Woesearchaeota archaeon]
MEFKKHPEWSEDYPAIDCIAKPERPAGYDENDNPIFYYQEDAVRKDISDLIELSPNEFREWYYPKRSAAETELKRWKTIASIPHLGYGALEHNLSAITQIGSLVNNLENGVDYLKKIKELYVEVHPDTSLLLSDL